MNQSNIMAALYDTGVLTQGKILEAYYNIFSNIIFHKNITFMKENELVEFISRELHIDFPPSFIRYIMSIGKKMGEVSYAAREYTFDIKREKTKIDEFNKKLLEIGKQYSHYANKNKVFINPNSDDELKKLVIDNVSSLNDSAIKSKELFFWSKFILNLQVEEPDLFDFISTIRFSMAYADFLFYNNYDDKYDELEIFLDTPIVLALLGFDDEERVRTALVLIDKLRAKNCKIKIFEKNYDEIVGILSDAKKHAYSSLYDWTKANNACKIMHDTMKLQNVEKIILQIKKVLKENSIEILDYNYNDIENKFHEGEEQLANIIKKKYEECSKNNEPDYKDESVSIDARNINIIYIMRHGKRSATLKDCKAILVTTNYTLFVISKNYKCDEYFIPAVVTEDYVVALLFANDIRGVDEYRTAKLVEICAEILKPTREVCEKFFRLVEEQNQEGKLTEEELIVLRNRALTDPIISEVSNNDPSLIVDETIYEVYKRIIYGKSKDYESLKNQSEKELSKKNDEISSLSSKLENVSIRDSERIKNAESFSLFLCGFLALILAAITTFIINNYFSSSLILTIFVYLISGLLEFFVIKFCLYNRILCWVKNKMCI